MARLDDIRVASPCSVSWDAMKGDERVRFCQQCRLNVYNLSGMSRGEAEQLVQQAEGRLCVRFHRRADGKLLTDDCPVGLRLARRASRRLLVSLLGGVATVLGITFAGCLLSTDRGRSSWLRQTEPFASILEWIDPSPPNSPAVMGW
jgi:hypothetical protein